MRLFRRIARRGLRTGRRAMSLLALLAQSIVARAHVTRVRWRRASARRSTAITRVLLYSPADLNVIDGSSIWVESVAATLAVGPEVWVTVPLRVQEKRTLLTNALRRLDRVEVLPSTTIWRGTVAPLDAAAALDWIERLDDEEPFDAFILRGFEMCLAALARPRFAGRLWSAYILEPERDAESPEYRAAMEAIAAFSRYVVAQTDQMRAATEERAAAARGRTILLPPAIPSAGPRADDRPVQRLIYTGKFAPFYPVPDLIDAFARLRAGRPDLEFHLVGDKLWRTADDHGYADALRSRVATVPGVVWHGGLSRAAVAKLLARGGVGLSIWDYRYGSHWNDLVVSTKLLDYCSAGLPVVLTRTVAQESILGADYPLFVDEFGEAEATIGRVLADERLYRDAAERCWHASRQFTYEAVHERLAPYLARRSGG